MSRAVKILATIGVVVWVLGGNLVATLLAQAHNWQIFTFTRHDLMDDIALGFFAWLLVSAVLAGVAGLLREIWCSKKDMS